MSTSSSSQRRKFSTGVSLEPDVVDYLERLTIQANLNRSWILNAIVREYARLAQSHGIAPGLPEIIIK
jgi:hypothetical protein